MESEETYLVIGFTNSARELTDQLQKLPEIKIIWVGEGDTPEPESEIEVVNINNPSWPDNVKELTEKYEPRMVFISPRAEHDLTDLTEGDNLERLLHQQGLRLDGVPTIVISDEHHS